MFLSLVSRVSYNLHNFLSSLFLQEKFSVLVYIENDQTLCVLVCVCMSVVAQPEIHIHEVATEPLNVSGSEIKLLLQQLDR